MQLIFFWEKKKNASFHQTRNRRGTPGLVCATAFNVLKNKQENVQTMLKALGTLNEANKLTTRYSMDMRKFDETKASEPRMVWQLGLLYYSLLNVEIWSTLVTATKNIYTTPIQNPFEIYDSLEDWNNDDDAKVFHRELFDGSIRTMSALIEFLDPGGDLANIVDAGRFQVPKPSKHMYTLQTR